MSSSLVHQTCLDFERQIFAIVGPGAPATYAPNANQGSQYTDASNGNFYVMVGTTWTLMGSSGGISQSFADSRYWYSGSHPTTISGYGLTDAVSKAGDTMTGALSHTLGSVSVTAASSAVSGDSASRWYRQTDGYMAWGPGTAATDVAFYRSAASQMTLLASLSMNGNLTLSADLAEVNTTYGGVTTTRFFTSSAGGVISVDGSNAFRFKYGGKTGTDVLVLAPGGASFFSSATMQGGYGSTGTGNQLVIGGGGTSPNAGSFSWGDGTGWQLVFGTKVAGAFASRFTFTDGGNFYANGPITSYSTGLFAGAMYLGFQLTGAATSGASSGDMVVQRSSTVGYTYFGGNLARAFGSNGASFWMNDVLQVAGNNGFTIGALNNTQRITYGASTATAFGLLTATNGYADLYLASLFPTTSMVLGTDIGGGSAVRVNGSIGTNGYINFKLGMTGTDYAYIGAAQSAGALINGSGSGDLCIRAQGSAIIFSGDSGSTAFVKMGGGTFTQQGVDVAKIQWQTGTLATTQAAPASGRGTIIFQVV